MNDKIACAVAIAVAVILTWRSAVTADAVLEFLGIQLKKKEGKITRRLRTMREVKERNDERIRKWEERHG